MHQLTQLRIIIFLVLVFMSIPILTTLHSPPKAEGHVSKYPIIIVPGFSGTSLVAPDTGAYINDYPDGHGGTYSHFYPAGEEIWINRTQAALPGFDDYFDILKLEPDGTTQAYPIGRQGYVKDVYQPTVDYFLSKGYSINRDLYVFTYDWRKDIRENDELFQDMIQNAKMRTGLPKVNIVAHSMGGLILRNYLTNPDNAQNINRAVSLGTPYLGAPESLKWLKYGGCIKYPVGPACLSLASSETRDIVQNYPSVYQLLPSQKYYDFYNNHDPEHISPVKDSRDEDSNGITGDLSYTQTKELLTNLGFNTTLYTQAEELHTNIDTTFPVILGGEMNIIVGSGKPTLGQIEEQTVVEAGNIQLNKKDLHMVNGDTTVPLYSASLNDSANGQLLTGNAHVYYTNKDHNSLPGDPNTLSLINFLFNGDTTGSYNYQGITTNPIPLTGHLVSVHSPVDLHIYNNNGQHTGLNEQGEIESNIPGSYYDTIEDTKYIWLPDNGTYSIKMNATDQGFFDLKMRTYQNNKINDELLFENVAITNTTTANLTLNTNDSQPPLLNVDRNNDGITDQIVYVSNKFTDTTPPVTLATNSGQLGNNDWYRNSVTVTLHATDDSDSTENIWTTYSLDYNPFQIYDQPIEITTEGIHTLRYWSKDSAGNPEIPQGEEIHIDLNAPEAVIAFNPQSQNNEIMGSDTMSSVVNVTTVGNTTELTDEAGYVTTLQTNTKEGKNKLELESITYPNQSPIYFSKNKLQAEVSKDKKTDILKEVEQKLIINQEEKITAKYSAETNSTKVKEKSLDKTKQEYTLTGIGSIKLKTEKGSLTSEVSL